MRIRANPLDRFVTTPFQFTENSLFDKKRALQKEHFRSFAEKGRISDSQDRQVTRPGSTNAPPQCKWGRKVPTACSPDHF